MLLKILIIFSVIIILDILSRISFLAAFLLSAIYFFVIALLFIIILTLITDIKIFHKSKFSRNKAKKDADNHHYSIINYQDIEVSYTWNLNGGGLILAYEFVHLVSQKIGKVRHIFEYCSGPGFIGFSLLANNLCDQLTLADINPRAIDTIKETIKNNHLQDKVSVYQSDCLDSIPDNEQWDLVVGNPPWDLVSGNPPWYKDKKTLLFAIQRDGCTRNFIKISTNFLSPMDQSYLLKALNSPKSNAFKI